MPDFMTIGDTDKIDLHKATYKVEAGMQFRNKQMAPLLAGCYTVFNGKGRTTKVNHMGGVSLQEKTGRKERVPNMSPDRSSRFIHNKDFWGSICFDGTDFIDYEGNPTAEFSKILMQAHYQRQDVEAMRALCGFAYRGTYCNQTKTQLSKCNILPDDCTGLTPDKIRKAAKILQQMTGGDGEIVLGISQCQMFDLSYFDEFTNGDYFMSGGFFENGGMGSTPWMNVRFKTLQDWRREADSCCLDPAMKIDKGVYGDKKLQRRWLPMWKRDALGMTQPRPPKLRLIDGNLQGYSIGTIIAHFESSFGFARMDDCAVVMIPVCEEVCNTEECC